MKIKNVYVVDDDVIFHFIIKKLFLKSNLDVQVKFFFNGFDAVEGLKENQDLPDLILLDINMPIYDAWQFLDEFKKIKKTFNKDISVYLLSSSNDVSDINKAVQYKSEIKKFYNKPVTIDELKTIFAE